jgi:hypothetical protein
MASDYLSIKQTCEALSMTEEQVKALVSQGKLHEVRDAGKIFFRKAEIVEIAGKEGSSVVDLEATDEAAPAELNLDDSETFASALSSLADSSATLGAIDESPIPDEPPSLGTAADGSPSDFGSGLSFGDEDETPQPAKASRPTPKKGALTVDDIPEQLAAAPAEDSTPPELSSEIDLLPVSGEDSSPGLSPAASPSAGGTSDELPDLGLSGSSIISLEPGGDSSFAESPIAKEGTKFSKVGINVFEDEDLGVETDPMGETQISSGAEDFDAVGSGSGLLDMTQESDDTSLGPELLDVISPSDAAETETEAEVVADTADEDDDMAVMEEPVGVAAGPAVSAPRVATAQMAGAVPMNVCLFLGLLGLAVLGLATASVIQGVWPEKVLGLISKGVVHYSVFGGIALITIVTGVLSILADRGK